jgi:predicted membrane protein
MLKFHAGIDDITIKVGNVLSGNKIEIQGTAANVELTIPKDIGVMMYYKHLIGKLNTPGFEALSGHYFQSQNLATSKATLNIFINL